MVTPLEDTIVDIMLNNIDRYFPPNFFENFPHLAIAGDGRPYVTQEAMDIIGKKISDKCFFKNETIKQLYNKGLSKNNIRILLMTTPYQLYGYMYPSRDIDKDLHFIFDPNWHCGEAFLNDLKQNEKDLFWNVFLSMLNFCISNYDLFNSEFASLIINFFKRNETDFNFLYINEKFEELLDGDLNDDKKNAIKKFIKKLNEIKMNMNAEGCNFLIINYKMLSFEKILFLLDNGFDKHQLVEELSCNEDHDAMLLKLIRDKYNNKG